MAARTPGDVARPRVVLLVSLGALVLAAALLGTAHGTGARWHLSARTAAPAPPGEPAPDDTATFGRLPVPDDHGRTLHFLGWLLLGLGVALLVLVVVLVVRWWLGRPRPVRAGPLAVPDVLTVADDPEVQPDVERVRRGFDRAFAELDTDREPSDAIVAAWLGLEEAAQDAGVARRVSETPTELTSRLLTALAVDPDASRTLLDLYQRVRFGGREGTAADVATARRSLETMTSGWRRADRWTR